MAAIVETPTTTASGPDARRRRSLAALWRGRADDAVWVRPALLGLLAVTALLYLVGLSRNGWANEYYSAAAQAGSESWKAWFFGASDSSSFITVDKPPASLWVMGLSVRLFGLSSFAVLLPQALMGVASVGLLYAAVRRVSGPAAGLLAGAVMAVTPVATLMFRFNNPDALLVLLLVAAAYAVVRAIESGATRWLVLAGVLVGFGFLTKMLQAFLVLPAFGIAYLVAGPAQLGKRVRQLLVAGVAVVVSAGWYIALVELLPESVRPYIGGSQNNSILELTLGYNGLGRITGDETGSFGFGNGAGSAFGGAPRLTRLFGEEFGGQTSWLLPAALIAFVGLLWVTRRSPRTDRVRAAALLWGGWLLVTGLVFSYMNGIIHGYYTVALVPAIAALVGMAAAAFWRAGVAGRVWLAAMIGVTTWWSTVLLGRSPDFQPWLRLVVGIAGVAAVAAVLAPLVSSLGSRYVRGLSAAGIGAGLIVALAAPLAYSLETAASTNTGSLPSAGPTTTSGGFGGGGAGGPGGGGGPGGQPPQGAPGGRMPDGRGGQMRDGQGGQAGQPGAVGGGGGGGLTGGSAVSGELVALLQAGSAGYDWAAAAVGSTGAAALQLASEEPVLALGGFNGTDPSPTLAEFQQLVADGRVHYFISGQASFGGSDSMSQITEWVAANFASTTVGSQTVYDLTGGNGSSGDGQSA